MQFHRDTSNSINIISAFGTEGILVGERLLQPPCVVSVSTIIEQWVDSDVNGLSTDHLTAVIELEPELILLGSGSVLRFPSPDIAAAVNRHGIGWEVMDTAAACRTYNVLAHEGRTVAVALLPD